MLLVDGVAVQLVGDALPDLGPLPGALAPRRGPSPGRACLARAGRPRTGCRTYGRSGRTGPPSPRRAPPPGTRGRSPLLLGVVGLVGRGGPRSLAPRRGRGGAAFPGPPGSCRGALINDAETPAEVAEALAWCQVGEAVSLAPAIDEDRLLALALPALEWTRERFFVAVCELLRLPDHDTARWLIDGSSDRLMAEALDSWDGLEGRGKRARRGRHTPRAQGRLRAVTRVSLARPSP